MFKFLIVDDSRVMRRMLQNTLKAVGYDSSEFIEAADGRDALELLDTFDYDVDVIFCDLCMPNLDGLGLIEALSATGRLKEIPVVVCTGDIREARGREALEKGARKLVCKPFTSDNVSEALSDVMGQR